MWDLPRPRIEPLSPVLAASFLTSGLLGKSLLVCFSYVLTKAKTAYYYVVLKKWNLLRYKCSLSPFLRMYSFSSLAGIWTKPLALLRSSEIIKMWSIPPWKQRILPFSMKAFFSFTSIYLFIILQVHIFILLSFIEIKYI